MHKRWFLLPVIFRFCDLDWVDISVRYRGQIIICAATWVILVICLATVGGIGKASHNTSVDVCDEETLRSERWQSCLLFAYALGDRVCICVCIACAFVCAAAGLMAKPTDLKPNHQFVWMGALTHNSIVFKTRIPGTLYPHTAHIPCTLPLTSFFSHPQRREVLCGKLCPPAQHSNLQPSSLHQHN